MTRAGEESRGAVLVVGGGIAGMAAGAYLAEWGQPVYLLEAGPAIGGSMHLLDHTFPTNSCGLCLMLPKQPALCPTLECERQERLKLLPYAELAGVTGEEGAYRARIRHKARYVDVERCNDCGACAAVCPEARPHDHEGWNSPVKAIYRPAGLRAVPSAWVIDMAYCTRCGACVKACPEKAIDLEMAEREEEVAVGAVLLTPGYAAYDARLKGEYGYGQYANVVTSLAFERMVSLAGSGGGRLERPSDGAAPRRVAVVQCVGSRDRRCGAGHCSSVCCMYTAKQVALAKKLAPELEMTVYYMDLRAMGKGYEEYLAEVQGLAGVTYRRAMPSRVYERPGTGELLVGYVGEEGKLHEEAYDLVVLAVGFAPPAGMQAAARELGVELNEYGFAVSDGAHPARTGRPGVYVAGAFREPKDIPETVAEAAAAAGEVLAYLGRPAVGRAPASAAQREVADEEARVGVFVCACEAGGLAGIDAGEVASWAAGQPGVALAAVVAEGCGAAGRAEMTAAIEREKLNRVVVAGCSARLAPGGDGFEGVMRGAGLDPRLLEVVGLREQVAYPHRGNGADLTGKARSLVGMAAAKLRAMSGVEALAAGARALPQPIGRAVVIGGGAAGMAAARQLSALGIAVELVERSGSLGGQWREIRYQPDGAADPQAQLAEWIAAVESDPRIRVHLGAELKELAGQPGRYRSAIVEVASGAEEEVEHGALVVATGGHPAATGEYLYGQNAGVVTQRELEQRLSGASAVDLAGLKAVVMVQCVGSREAERPYCSRICCTQAVKNALKLKALRPEIGVYVLYREVRTFGFREAYYEAARAAGVVFLRYELEGKPRVRVDGERLRVELKELVTGQGVELGADLVVLSVGIEAEEEGALAARLGVERAVEGFFAEEHPKMKPLDLKKGGLYVAGLAHSPRFLEEAIVQGQGAGMRAAAYLAPGEMEERATAVWVNPRLCSYCGLCVAACPYGARVMDEEQRVAVVDYSLCQGCGVCAVVCPNKATLQKAFEHKQLLSELEYALV